MSDAGTVYRVIVPYSLPRELWPNEKRHWGTKARVVKQVRRDVAMVAREAIGFNPLMLEGDVRAEIRIGWPQGQARRLDPDNALSACKAILDGLTDAGFWRSDHRVHAQVVEQVLWGKQDAGTRAQYPQGWIAVDVMGATV